MVHNMQFLIWHRRFLKPSSVSSHRRHGHKNTPPFRNLITSATYYLSSLISFSECDGTTVDYSIVNSQAKTMTFGTGNSRSGTAITSETS